MEGAPHTFCSLYHTCLNTRMPPLLHSPQRQLVATLPQYALHPKSLITAKEATERLHEGAQLE